MDIKHGLPTSNKGECNDERFTSCEYRTMLPDIIKDLVGSCLSQNCFEHINADPLPSRGKALDLVQRCQDLLFPGYFRHQDIDKVNLEYHMGLEVSALYDRLAAEITYAIRHECVRHNKTCQHCDQQGKEKAFAFLQSLGEMRQVLATDVRATYDGDPAVSSYDEIIFCYPGIQAITIYRIAHRLYELEVPILPRIMTEYAHSVTGIDIHPGAQIGESFFIDHGTGVVIGQTCEIGNQVKIYQGVTLGALSFTRDQSGKLDRHRKRHPTLEDNVTVYAGTTILGGDTIIGKNSVVGGNVWLTKSIPPNTKVLLNPPELIIK
ncbi:MAG: serine acetyltransferase [Desulfobulbaceae bacterium]|nr:MAG: serine acetyltransferase [Desulfobulbaceae bacterium]